MNTLPSQTDSRGAVQRTGSVDWWYIGWKRCAEKHLWERFGSKLWRRAEKRRQKALAAKDWEHGDLIEVFVNGKRQTSHYYPPRIYTRRHLADALQCVVDEIVAPPPQNH